MWLCADSGERNDQMRFDKWVLKHVRLCVHVCTYVCMCVYVCTRVCCSVYIIQGGPRHWHPQPYFATIFFQMLILDEICNIIQTLWWKSHLFHNSGKRWRMYFWGKISRMRISITNFVSIHLFGRLWRRESRNFQVGEKKEKTGTSSSFSAAWNVSCGRTLWTSSRKFVSSCSLVYMQQVDKQKWKWQWSRYMDFAVFAHVQHRCVSLNSKTNTK